MNRSTRKLRVFLSWSGIRSRLVAEALKDWLPRMLQNVEPWMSSQDIEKGARWSVEIGDQLAATNVGIVCVTPENQFSSWLNFEAGALAKSMEIGKVCPFLFGMKSTNLRGPLEQFQVTTAERKEILALVVSLNAELGELGVRGKLLEETFELVWPQLRERMDSIAGESIEGSFANIAHVVTAFAEHGLPRPAIGDEVYFESGFEGHGLYDALLEVSQRRLFVLGRKNRKMFDKDHGRALEALAARVRNGLDLRLLFLHPDAPRDVMTRAHRDPDFRDQLVHSIERAAVTLVRYGLRPSAVSRKVPCMELGTSSRNEH